TAAWVDNVSIKAGGGDAVYLQLADETVLEALIRTAETTGEHFILSPTGRQVLWLRADQRASGLRAVSGGDPMAITENTAALLITDVAEI
ncbi:MAG: hypothetical protein GW928_01175, partial [Rhodoferax sp.]|nr:hypothetical protein [Rhodoferax sp.]